MGSEAGTRERHGGRDRDTASIEPRMGRWTVGAPAPGLARRRCRAPSRRGGPAFPPRRCSARAVASPGPSRPAVRHCAKQRGVQRAAGSGGARACTCAGMRMRTMLDATLMSRSGTTPAQLLEMHAEVSLPILVELASNLDESVPTFGELPRPIRTLAKVRATSAQTRPTSGRSPPVLGIPSDCGPSLANLMSKWPKLGPCTGRFRPNFPRARPAWDYAALKVAPPGVAERRSPRNDDWRTWRHHCVGSNCDFDALVGTFIVSSRRPDTGGSLSSCTLGGPLSVSALAVA